MTTATPTEQVPVAPAGWTVRRALALVASCVGASFVVWMPSLFAGFTGDDLEGILRASPGGRRFTGLDYSAVQWRPLSNLSLHLDRSVWGLDASGFHLTNVALNGLVAALVAVLGPIEILRQAQIDTSSSFNYTPYVGAALIFIALTIPMSRFADWVQERSARRRRAGGAA